MNKALTKLGALFITSTLLTSCGVSSEPSEDDYKKFKPVLTEKSLAAKKSEITGELGEYLNLKNSDTKVSYLGMNKPFAQEWSQEWEVKVNVIRTSETLPYDLEIINGNYTNLVLSIYDSEGAPITGLNPVQNKSGHDLVDQVLSLKEGQDGWVTFIFRSGDINQEDIITKWEQFSISSEIGFVKNSTSSEDNYEEDVEQDEQNIANSNNGEWDEMLNDYEDYVDEYIKFYKMAVEGELSAMSQYTALMQKATALQQSIVKAQNNNELNTTQIQRMMKIQIKMTNAALEMQN